VTDEATRIQPGDAIRWRLRLSSPPERVFSAWLSPDDHIRFWSERSEREVHGFRLHFIDGTVEPCTVVESVSPSHIALQYFGSRVDVSLERLGSGTDLTLTARGVPLADWPEVFAGWLNVLLPFKAWVDFGVDLRSHDPQRTWRQGYADQ
jgi:uncharacterized protein YndB with AHSA1/START domain